MLTLYDDDADLVLMALQRIESDAARQLSPGGNEGCSGAAWFCTRLCLRKVSNLIERIEQHLKDEVEERDDAGPKE